MKIITLLLLIVTDFAFAQDVYIPDGALKAKLLASNQGIDANNDGEIQYAEALSVTDTLFLNGTTTDIGTIADLTGIEAFENITGLNVSSNHIETFNCQNAHLKYLDIKFNSLTQVDVSNCEALTSFNCNNNQLNAIDVSNNPLLSVLYCANNSLAALDVTANTALATLHCGTNNLTALDISQNINLESLYCFYNNITTLNLDTNPQLLLLSCGNNPGLAALDFSNTPLLIQLNCVATAVQSLNLSMCPDLSLLICNGCPQLKDINLKNGFNYSFSTMFFGFSDLSSLETVCLDNQNSGFALWLQSQVNVGVTIDDVCLVGTDTYENEPISVYPNPAGNMLYISGADISEVYIYNSLAQQAGVYKEPRQIDLSAFPQGFYVVYIKLASGKVTVKKVLKS